MRLVGASALALAYVAAGRFDAFYQFGLSYWDIAAALALIAEAGGASDKRGDVRRDMDVVGSNGRLHRDLAKKIGW